MTTDRATLLALADRVEAASGPDRALSADILKAVGYTTHAWRVFDPNGKPCPQVPDVLASLDAALSLVKEGIAWTLGQNVHHRYWAASLNILGADGEPQSISWGQAATPAVALTCAALRALAQEAPSDG